jgi:hypothetical protein
MNKRGQAESIIIFFILVVSIFVAGIVVLRVVNEFTTPFSSQIGNITAQAGEAVTYTHNKFTGFWDTAIIFMFIINTLLLFVSAFLVDIHPAFIIVYLLAIIFLFIFGNMYLNVLDGIWNGLATSVEASQSPLQIFIINNFNLIMLGIVILSGVVMYAKFKFFGQGGGAGGSY